MSTQQKEYTVGGAVLQLAFLPVTLAWAVVKGVFVGILAAVGISIIS